MKDWVSRKTVAQISIIVSTGAALLMANFRLFHRSYTAISHISIADIRQPIFRDIFAPAVDDPPFPFRGGYLIWINAPMPCFR